ncbi:MAG: tripartite tricarboxylate transporter substrate binding protein [Deltaproteobacteria bacterium]|nr:tripartite tricarboxylate transporter substrate binding protein [Deltaproteobacteria bacterium]
MKAKSMTIMVVAAAALVLAAGAQVQGVWAQAWPSKPIKIIVPFPPGNTTDTQSRLIAPTLSERLGQPVIVENRPGASGMLGTDLIAKAAPDGYTIGTVQGGTMVVLPHTSKSIPYDALKDLAPISMTTTNYLVIFSNPSAPFKRVSEMIAYAKANPGKLTVASNGEGGFPHLAFEHLRLMAGFTYNYIPYKGSAQISMDVIGGQVQVGIDGVAAQVPHIKSGRLNLIAVTSKNRAAFWPDKPAAAEDLPGYESGGWFGFAAPAGTPREIIQRLNAEINRAYKPDVVEKMVAGGMVVVSESPKYFDDVIKSDYARYGKLVRDIGFKPQ